MNYKFSKIISISLIFLAVLIGLYTRVFTYNNFISFGPDQIRDSIVYMNMKNGLWPALGPIAPLNDNLGFHLFPLYHYLIGFFTLYAKDLNSQLLVNGILAFMAIPLFILFTYRLLENTNQSIRLTLSGLAGLWLSVFVNDIVNTNLAWNPSPMLFFIFLFLLVVDKLHRVKMRISLAEHFILWTLLGIVTAFLSSLHTWSMVTFLPLFLFNSIYFTFFYYKIQHNRKLIYPFIGILYFLLFISTYLIGEISTGWINTQNMLSVINDSSQSIQTSLFEVLSRPFINYLLMVEKAYIVEPKYQFLALLFSVVTIFFGIFNFKGNKFLLGQIIISLMIYSLGISFYSGEFKSRYQIIIWYMPILTSILSLAYTPKNIYLKVFQIFYTVVFITLSIYFNWNYTLNFLNRVYGDTKLIDTDEIINILTSLPDRSTICYPWGVGYDYYPQFKFIDQYITLKAHILENNCVNSEYYIHLKNIPASTTAFDTIPNQAREYQNAEVVLEGSSFKVFRLSEI